MHIKQAILNTIDNNLIKFDEPMNKHTTFRVGGAAKILVSPNNYSDMQKIIELCNEFNENYFLLGNGSNTIVRDSGFNGVIIKTKNLNTIKIDGTRINSQSGVLLPSLAQKTLHSGLSGMEFLSGIPGTVGGASVINAGAYGNEIFSIIESVKVLLSDGSIKDLDRSEINYSYRHTDLEDKNIIVLETIFNLRHGNPNDIKLYMDTFRQKRQKTQPLEFPNAGSIFKKSGEYAAGYLIDQLGLKGLSIGGAEISEKHANFIINKNNASANDILALIDYTKNHVQEKFDITLDTEVIIL